MMMAPNVISQALSNMAASKTSIISTAASLAASAVLLRTIANDLFPRDLRRHLSSALAGLLHRLSSEFTVIIEEYEGIAVNQLYSSAEVYLGSISSPSTRRVRAGKSEKERSITIAAEQGQEITDVFDGIRLKWVLVHREAINRAIYSHGDYGSSTIRTQIRYFRLVFDKSHKNKVVSSYLPYMVEKAKAMKEAKKGLKLHMLKQEHNYYPGRGETWTSVNFDHPATFETLAMEPDVKRSLIDDLGRFVAGKEYYRKVGKAWKRGYLLYGPPGTGKSSLIAAIANHLSYNVYDLELADLRSNSELRKLLLSTSNRSILVVEDIDCSIDLSNQRAEEEQAAATSGRRSGRKLNQDYRVTLSGLLNFIDGLWSSCGDERIVIFTTNHREKLDPALLRPGRMDVHIHMSYCTPSGFRTLAENYLGVTDHHLFEEIDGLIQEVQVTPAEVAEELMKNSDPNAVLQMFIQFLQEKKTTSIEHGS